MNNRLFKLGALLVVLMLFAAFNTFAQLSTVYVDVTNGSDTYTGANATNSPAGTGAKATIGGGLGAVANNGTIIIMAGSYNGVDNGGGNVDINSTTYTRLTAGGSLTIQLQTLLANQQVLLSAGNFIYNVSGGTLNITTTSGTEYFTLGAGAASLTLGGGTNSSNMNIPTNTFFQLPSGSSIVMNVTSAFTSAAPKVGANITLTYQGGSSVTGGPESNYATYGTGTITVNKSVGTTLTLPNAITKSGGFTITSGNVTFGSNVSMATSDITNNGSGTVTFNGALSFTFTDGTATGNVGSIVNTSTGSVVATSTATWTAGTLTAGRTFAAGAGTYIVDNQSTGTINLAGAITLNNSQTNSAYIITVTANNGAAGTLSLGTLSAPSAGTGPANVVLNVQTAAAAGTVNFAGGTVLGSYTTGAGSTTNVNGAMTITGAVSNAGTMKLTTNTLTLNGAVTHAGGTITATSPAGVLITAAATVSGGTFPDVTVTSAGTATFSGSTTVNNFIVNGAVTVNTGVTLTVNASATETADVTLTGTAEMDIAGDFNGTSGNFTANTGASTVKFNGAVNQAVNSGPNFQVTNLTFANTVATSVITLGASIRATGVVTINASNTVALGTLNIILNAAGASMTNNGTYTATGGGGVVLGGVNTIVGGSGASMASTLSGTGKYSYITVDVTTGNTVTLAGSVQFTGVLTLRSGTLTTGTNDISPYGTGASVVRWVQSAGAINTAGGTFDGSTVDYDLTYTETLTGGAAVTAGASEFATANIRNLTVSTTAFTLTLNSAADITVKGNMVLSSNALFVLPARNFTVNGALTVNTGVTMSGGNSGKAFTLVGDGQTHTVAGTITAANILTVTGNGSALNGSTATADAAQVDNLAFEPTAVSATFTSTNLKVINTGPLTVEGTSSKTGAVATITMNTTSSTLTGNIAIGAAGAPTVAVTIAGSTTSTHTGNIGVSGGTLTYTRGGNSTTMTGTVAIAASSTLALGSNVTVTSTTSQTGNLNLGAYNYTAQDAYTHAGTGTVTGTGTFVIAYTAGGPTAFTLTSAVTIPNVQLKASAKTNIVQLASNNLTVSNALTLTKGTFDFNNLAVTFTGATITTNVGAAGDVAFNATTAGTLNIGNGTSGSVTWTSNDDVTLPAATTLVLNSAGTVTFVSDKETASTPAKRTWTLVNLTYTAATGFVTGINDIKISGLFDRSSASAGTWTQATGYLYFNGTTAFMPGTGFAIDNLNVGAAISSNTVASDLMTVNKNLVLTNTPGVLTMNAGKLTLGDGCLIERQADGAKLSAVPTFAGAVSVTYTTGAGGVTTAANFYELPASVTNFSVITPQAVTLPKNVTVNGTLTLSGNMTNTVTTKNITMANNSTLDLQAVGTTVLNINPVLAGTLNIVYEGTFAVSTRELGTVTSGAYTKVTGNVEFKSGTITLDNALTMGGTVKFSGGGFEMAANNITVQGDVIQTNSAGFFTNGGAAASLTFGGATNTALTLKATWALPASNVIQFTVNKTSASNMVTLSGGDLDFAQNSAGTAPASPNTLYLTSGQLVTGTQNVILKQSYNSTTNQPVQGFSGASMSSYVVGQVKKFVDYTNTVGIALVTFPVGTPTPSNYRPLSIYFKTAPANSVNITVSHMDMRAGGQNGFPVTFTNNAGQTVKITNYPAFYWYVKSDISLNPSYQYDFEAQAQGYTDYINDQIQNVRLVRRDSGSVNNPWILQQNWLTNVAQYDNSTIASNWPVVKVISATGGITTQGSIFSYSQNNKAPAWTTAPANLAAKEGDTLKINYASTDPDFGDFPTISAITLPTGATMAINTASGANPATATINWVIPYTIASAATPTATATITLRTTDSYGPLSKDTTITVTVTNVNRAPAFSPRTVAATIKNTDTLKVTMAATDPDGNTLTYSFLNVTPATTNAPTVTGTSLTWVATFAEAAKSFVIKALVSDGVTTGLGPTPGTDTLTINVTVNRTRVRGDVDGNGLVQAADAAYVLKYVAGVSTAPVVFTDASVLYAADASNNGTVTAYDAALILQAAAGLITLPPLPIQSYAG